MTVPQIGKYNISTVMRFLEYENNILTVLGSSDKTRGYVCCYKVFMYPRNIIFAVKRFL